MIKEKFDPHKNKETYLKWREAGGLFPGVSEKTAELMRNYLDDMEIGANVNINSKKGPRSYIRLRNLKTKIHSWCIIIEKELGIDYFPDLVNQQREFLQLIKKLRDGKIMNRSVNNPQPYRGVGTMIKSFKAMWHWYMKVQRKQGTTVEDIVQDIDGQDPKPHFNYITVEQLEKLCSAAKYDYRVLMMFLFDTGIRAPTELMNVKVSDLEWDKEKNHYTLDIRDETSKTFGRRIKLLLCSELLKKYIATREIKKDEFIFTKKPGNMNKYIKRLAFKHLKIGSERKERRKLSTGAYHYYLENGLTLYDFRHSSACYWLPRYKSESALKYRFGWVKSAMIHYYTNLLGMRDTINEEDIYLDVSKTQLEKEITSKGNEITMLQEQLAAQEKRMEEIAKLMTILQQEKTPNQKAITVFLE